MANTSDRPNGVEVLIVEDSPTQAEQLKYALERRGFQVTTAADGNEALELLEQHQPSLVITDIVMPAMDGYQLCRAIKETDWGKSLPVVLLTSLSDPRDVIRGLECGADNFLTKPYDEKYLHSRIQYLLANMQLRETEKTQFGVEVVLAGEKYFIKSDRIQILNLLLSSYEAAIQKNGELSKIRDELKDLNNQLEEKVKERTAALMGEIRERQRAEEVVRRRNAELERFTYTVSHDLKSPLVTILSFIGQLEQDLESGDAGNVKVDLDFIREAARKMSALLDSLLHLSRGGREIGDPQRVDLQDVARQALALVGDRHRHAAVQITIPDDLPLVKGDPVRLCEVFQNLVENAAKFTARQPEPQIEIGSTAGAGEILCFVRDNGIGIPPAYQERVFGLFEKLDPHSEGTGIGLAIVRRIVEEHGGRAWVESAGEGQGSTFFFSLPVAVCEEPARRKASSR